MKKVLFATTALVATAGVASADVKLSGWAEVGIYGGTGMDASFFTDIDVTFSMTGEADNGLKFGAKIDLDESDGSGRYSTAGCIITDNDDIDAAMTINGEPVDFGNVVGGVTEGGAFSDGDNDNAECIIPAGTVQGNSNAFTPSLQGGETYFLAYGNARLDMGDTDGAFDKVMKEVNLVGGSINDAETGHVGFSGNAGLDGFYDGQIATFSYAFEGFTVAASVESDDSGVGDAVFGIGLAYSGDFGGTSVGAGVGYQSVSVGPVDTDIIGLSLNAGFGNGFQAGINYSELTVEAFGVSASSTHTAFGIGYEMNALGIGLNYGQVEAGGFTDSGFGLAVVYDLGGGLEAQFGYGQSNIDGGVFPDTTIDSWSLGLAMSF